MAVYQADCCWAAGERLLFGYPINQEAGIEYIFGYNRFVINLLYRCFMFELMFAMIYLLVTWLL